MDSTNSRIYNLIWIIVRSEVAAWLFLLLPLNLKKHTVTCFLSRSSSFSCCFSRSRIFWATGSFLPSNRSFTFCLFRGSFGSWGSSCLRWIRPASNTCKDSSSRACSSHAHKRSRAEEGFADKTASFEPVAAMSRSLPSLRKEGRPRRPNDQTRQAALPSSPFPAYKPHDLLFQ